MAHLTRLSDAQARTLFDTYGLDLTTLEPLPAHGTVNSNYRARASGRDWFLRLNEGKTAADVDAEVALVDRLVAADVPTPQPVRTPDGRAVVEAAARPATLFPWLRAREAAPDAHDPATVAVAGEALGRVHRAGAGLGREALPRNHYTLAELERRLGTFANDPRVADVVPMLACELERARKRPEAPSGLIHQDLFPDNVLVDERHQLVAVLDFEQATWGCYVYDLVVAINAWCWTGTTIHGPAMAALVAAYEAYRPLDPSERLRLVDEARLGAARFAITRITDVFLPAGVDPDLQRRKDYRDYVRRLQYWVDQA